MEKNEEINLTNTLGYKKYESQIYGLSKKLEIARQKSFIFNQKII